MNQMMTSVHERANICSDKRVFFFFFKPSLSPLNRVAMPSGRGGERYRNASPNTRSQNAESKCALQKHAHGGFFFLFFFGKTGSSLSLFSLFHTQQQDVFFIVVSSRKKKDPPPPVWDRHNVLLLHPSCQRR